MARLSYSLRSFARPALRFFGFILHLRDQRSLDRTARRIHWRYPEYCCAVLLPVIALIGPCVANKSLGMVRICEGLDFTAPDEFAPKEFTNPSCRDMDRLASVKFANRLLQLRDVILHSACSTSLLGGLKYSRQMSGNAGSRRVGAALNMHEPLRAGCASPRNDGKTFQEPLQDAVPSGTAYERGSTSRADQKRHHSLTIHNFNVRIIETGLL